MEQSEYYGDRNSVELESPDKVWSQWDSCRDDASSLSVPKDTNMSGNEGLTEAFVDSFCENMEKYELVKDISSGNFGVARLMRAKNSKELVAVKFIERGPKIDENLVREIINHRSLRHPNVIGFKEVALTRTHIAIVMEYAAGGELFERIYNAGRFSEDEARYFFQQLISAVSYCHDLQLCHRDLKLENTHLDGSPAPRLKICDFRYFKSSFLHPRPESTAGTPAYLAPEVLSSREYDGKMADVWSCGVILYVMLVGAYPFEDQDYPKDFRKTIQRILAVKYKIPDYVHISQDCKHLISRIFVDNALTRITIAEIKKHPWFLKNLPSELTETPQAAYASKENSTFSLQSIEEIMKIMEEAKTHPKSGLAGGNPSDQETQGRQLQNRGPRPSSLSVNKNSHKIKKPPMHLASPPRPDQALLIYNVSPKVIHTTPSEFMNVVHRLTGISSDVFPEPGSCNSVSPAARLAAMENASLRGDKEPARDETDEMEEAAEFGGYEPTPFPGMSSPAVTSAFRTCRLEASGILSPSPEMLPTPSFAMFSSEGSMSPFLMYSPGYTSAPNNMQDSELSIGSFASKDYDVVIRYRRGDISKEDFVSHLRAGLCRRGISVHGEFDETDAVPECRVLILFLTSTYVPSNLVNIVEHQRKEPQVVYPIFYGISPSDVITNSKYYERFFLQDEHKRWQAALQEVTQIPGYVLTDKSESELIDEIVRDALKVLCFVDKEKMIGMDTQVEEILSLLCIESTDVHSIGIWGTVGIGKTAIAEEIFRIISVQYETCVFLKDFHKEVEVKGHDAVREDFLSKILEVEPHIIRISDIKLSFLKSRLQRKRVLIVLDDVNDFRDAETVLGKFNYFGPGSRIIITSRNRHVFVQCKIDHVYEVKPLDTSQSLLLLNRDTLQTTLPHEIYKTLSLELVKFSSGNPQVLQFCNKSEVAWAQLTQQVQKASPIYIPGIFERSCCGLDDNERSIFLDIACFFKRMDKDDVAMLLDGCGFSAHIGFRNLVDKSLLTISHNMVDMLRFIQATGREIVRHESADRPGDRSRLWDTEDIQTVFTDNTGTPAIEGIFLDMSKLKLDANPNVFDKMCNLRLLKFYFSKVIENNGVCLPQGLEYLPRKLRLLHWEYYPLSSLPQTFDPKNLVELNLPNSCAKKLWKGKKSLEKLKKMRLSYSYQLTKIPRLSSAPNLELLDLEGCKKLVSISQTVFYLKKLVFLNLKGCSNLESVPSMVDLESLEVLNLSGCSKLENFPEISPNVKELYLGGTMIQEIPSSIKKLVLLEKLDLENSRHLKNLPISICKLKHLETLNLSDCSSLELFPDLNRKMKCLKSLDLSRTAIKELPSSISYLTALEELRFVECKSLVRLPDIAWSLRFKVEFRQIDTDKFSKLWNRFAWLKKVQIS
ncbi:hypothetical protein Bca4012_026789 [Brassica carinata]